MNFFASNKQSYDVYFADTPGFDDSTRSDTDVLKNIVGWLGAMRERRIKLSGIIYLHRITDDRVGGTAWRNLRMLHNLVGADKMANVLLVSTRWEEVRTVFFLLEGDPQSESHELYGTHLAVLCSGGLI